MNGISRIGVQKQQMRLQRHCNYHRGTEGTENYITIEKLARDRYQDQSKLRFFFETAPASVGSDG